MQTPLQAACEADHIELAVFLVQKGADVRGVSTYGCAYMILEREDALAALATISRETGLAPDLADLVVGYRYASGHSGLAHEYAELLDTTQRLNDRLHRLHSFGERPARRRRAAGSI